MPEETENTALEQQEEHGVESTVMQALQVITGNQYNPSSAQVDRFLDLQEKGMDYTHKDNHTFLPKDILEAGKFVFVVMVIVGVLVFSTFYAKEYLGEIISGIFGLLAGGGVGFSIGSSRQKN